MGYGILWSCPKCRGPLALGVPAWSCRGCGARYRALRGIPDLRTGDDLYMSTEADWAFALKLDAAYERLDFRGLLDLYFDLSPEITPAQKDRQITHILTAPGRARVWLDAIGDPGSGAILDLGCGTGSFLSAARSVPTLGGVDIAMRWLLVARKRLDEEGLGRIPLACAAAEGLPLADAVLSGVVAGDVIEHVADQDATLAEAFRVLRPGGRLFMASPNRYSLAPEPHVGAWGVGFLPRQWMAPYVRWTRRLDFRAIHTLGYAEWVRKLAASPFGSGTIVPPALPPDDLAYFGPVMRALALVYNAAVATRVGRRAALAWGPLFHVVCVKPAVRGTPATGRSIHPRSRPLANRV